LQVNSKNQKDFAERIGQTPQSLNNMLKKRSLGTENTEREIAAKLGYPGTGYSAF
jgi:transcriptional regulator with XRE-family HTH domain